MSNRFTPEEIDTFAEQLRHELPPGSTVSTQVLHVSRSGMSREIAAYIVRNGSIVNISRQVAAIIGARYGDRGGVIMGGSGQDMTHALVYSLSRRLYPNGHKCTGSRGVTPTGATSKTPRCPSNDHTNDYGGLAREYDANQGQVFPTAPRYMTDSAYVAARQEWINAQESRLWSKRRTHRDGGYALIKVNL